VVSKDLAVTIAEIEPDKVATKKRLAKKSAPSHPMRGNMWAWR
jgi:hypothetical protein